jgi:hypothetical protein
MSSVQVDPHDLAMAAKLIEVAKTANWLDTTIRVERPGGMAFVVKRTVDGIVVEFGSDA